MPERRRVCFVLPSLNGGGAERAAVHLLNGLDAAAWNRSMFLFERRGPYLADVDPQIELQSAPDASRLGRWRAFRRFIGRTRPDVVMAFLSFATAVTAVRAARPGTKVVFNQQTPLTAFLADADFAWRGGWRQRAFTAGSRLAYGAADAIVATSNGVAGDLRTNFGVPPDRITVIPNPVDLDAVRARAAEPLAAGERLRGDGPVIVAAGRLADAKNYPLMLEALARLRPSVPAKLFILGEGDLEPALRRQAAGLGLDGAVTFLGFQTNPWKFINQADVLALSSHYEGFGNVLIESMALGVPVVATASAGTRDIVDDGRTGLLVEEHTADAFAAALRRLLQQPRLRQAMGPAARDAAARFATARVLEQYGALLHRLTA